MRATRVINRIQTSRRARLLLVAATSAAGLLSLTAAAPAAWHDRDYGRDYARDGGHDDRRDVRVDVSIGAPPPVVEDRTDRVWVEPVYRTVCDRVWVPAVTEDRCEQVWVPDRCELREVVHFEGHRRVVRTEDVVVEPAHYETRHTTVVVRDGHYEDVTRQEIVTPGHWDERVTRVAVEDSHPHGFFSFFFGR